MNLLRDYLYDFAVEISQIIRFDQSKIPWQEEEIYDLIDEYVEKIEADRGKFYG